MNTLKIKLLFGVLFLCEMGVVAQNNTHFSFSAYGEVYYSYDLKNRQSDTSPNYIYNHKRLNEVNANLLMVKAAFAENSTRANLGIMAGNYAQYNLANEPNWVQFIYEANMGVKIGKSTWVDAGILPSHIGFESAIGADCWTLTRSLLAENSPYFETGIKVSSTNAAQTLSGSFWLLNGWQRVERMAGAKLPSIGTQLTFIPTSHVVINYSTYFGDEKPISTYGFRTFHNFYVILTPKRKLNAQIGFDLGTERIAPKQVAVWFSPVLISRYTINNKNKIAVRLENYSDRNNTIIQNTIGNGIIINSVSGNYDYLINNKFQFRFEAKSSWLTLNKTRTNSSFALTTSLIFKL